jgi:hypothetical protein
VTEPGDVLLGRAEIERAFTALGERLARRGVVADVFVVGGAAMALAYDAARVTRDVDAVFKSHGIVLEEAARSPMTSDFPTGGLMSRPAFTSPARKMPASAGCSIIPDCALWRRHRLMSSQ